MRRLVIVGGVVLTRDLQDYDYDNDRGGCCCELLS